MILVMIAIFIIGFIAGFWVRSEADHDHLHLLKKQHREAEVITLIESERLKQDRMLKERME